VQSILVTVAHVECQKIYIYIYIYEIITPTNAPKIYNFIRKILLHISTLLGHLKGEKH
jgi:hypothetical protein